MYEHNQELYKVSAATKKLQVWYGTTDNDQVVVFYGEYGGTITEHRTTTVGKNIGKANETTAQEQAELELQAKYDSQISNKHYKLDKDTAIAEGKVCREPRKISRYQKRWQKMSPNLGSSTKKNGSRACLLTGQMYSKAGRPEDIHVEHLRDVVNELGELATYDAEVFAEGLSLQRIRSAWLKPVKTDKEVIAIAKDRAKKRGSKLDRNVTVPQAIQYLGYNPNDDAPKLKFYIFDIPTDSDATYRERVQWMHDYEDLLIQRGLREYFEFLYPVETHSHKERMELLDKVVSEGSEGLVHNEWDGVYEFGKRSTNSAKDKPRYDAEAFVTGIEECKNGTAKLILRASDKLDGVVFKAMQLGTNEERSPECQKLNIGKWFTFQYEELSADGIPTKPVVTKDERLCDENGEPLE